MCTDHESAQDADRAGGRSFASRSVPRHLARGVIGVGLLVASFVLVPLTGALSLLLALPGAYALRGCPGCWLAGLLETRDRARACPADAAPERATARLP